MDKNITLCPLRSDFHNAHACTSNCALYLNGKCAIAIIAEATRNEKHNSNHD